MPSIKTSLDRIEELCKVIDEQEKSFDNTEKFWKLSQKFDDLRAIFNLEDQINGGE